MQIRMYEHKAGMDAGRERTFSPGVQYDVPPVIGRQWVAAGCAVVVDEAAQRASSATAPKPRQTTRRAG